MTAFTRRLLAVLAAGGLVAAVGAVAPARAAARTPSAPRHVQARSVAGGVLVTWGAPATTNGSKITGYIVTPHLRGAGRAPIPVTTTVRSKTIGGLMVGATYTFTVAAKNAQGVGPASAASAAVRVTCVGVAMTHGQADIDAHPDGTTFCLSGTHNWTLRPRSGDQLVGPAVLDGRHATRYAIEAGYASNVTVSRLEVRNYTVGNQQGAIYVPNKGAATKWILRDLSVHDNGTTAGGAGVNLGTAWQVLGGRYWNNRQEGIGGSGPSSVITGVELDHNNFTNDHYTARNANCEFEAGGFKWVADEVTVRNSRVHDNACKGLWADINSRGGLIANNRVYNNWDEGIFVEISSGLTITGNRVTGNGFKSISGSGHGCPWLWGGGITLASSDHLVVAHNTVTGNCNGITGTQQNRPQGDPGLLQDVSIQHNSIAGPGGHTGVAQDNGADLSTRNISFASNQVTKGMTYCRLNC